MGLFEKAKALASNFATNEIVHSTDPLIKKKSRLIEKVESLGLFSDSDDEIETTDFSDVLKEVDNDLLLDLDEVNDKFSPDESSSLVIEESEVSKSETDSVAPTTEEIPSIDKLQIENEAEFPKEEEDEVVVYDVDSFPDFEEEKQKSDEASLETTFYSDETPEKEPSLENFTGEQETIEIGDDESISLDYNQSDDIKPEETIDLEQAEEKSEDDDSFADWEKDAKEEAEKDPLLSVEDEIMDQISKEEIIEEDLEKTSLESLNKGLEESKESLEQQKESASKEELLSLQRKTETYLVLVEISKELIKSKNFEDFFENLMYSLEGEIGPEAIMIFSAKDKSMKEFHLVTYDGVEVESEVVISSDGDLARIIKDIGQVCFTSKINKDNLSATEAVILENQSSEVISPIFYEKELVGFIITGQLISDEEYSPEDFEFMRLLSDMAGNFIMKLFDIVKIREEISTLNESIKLHESVSNLSDALYGCKSIDELYEIISDKLEKEFHVVKHTLFFISETDHNYKAFNSNYFSQNTISNLSISASSKLVTLVSQVTGMYKIENFNSYNEFQELIPEEELKNMKELSVFPLIHMGKLFGMLAVHEIEMEHWTSDLKQMLISVSNIISPVLANFILQTEKDVVFKNPFNPVQESVDREIDIANEENARFTLVVLKILSVSRIINLLGLEFFTSYSDFIISKIQAAVSESDYFSRVGQGKFAIFLRGKNKAQSEDFFKNLKSEFVKFPDPPKDFKLSIQLYSLTYPEQAKDKRRFIEIIEDT